MQQGIINMKTSSVLMSILSPLVLLLALTVTGLSGCAITNDMKSSDDKKNTKLVNSIDTIERPIIGGISQGILIRGTNTENPVLLYVHGGPGRPAYPLLHKSKDWQKIESLFTVAYWDQLGSGMSNPQDLDASIVNLERLIEDTAEVTNYLKKKFGKRKVYLLGHSWGSMLGSFAVKRYPELFHAYIGVGQTGNQLESEKETLAWLNLEAARRQDKDTLKILSELHFPLGLDTKEWLDYLIINRPLVSKYMGAWYMNPPNYDDYTNVMSTLPYYTESEREKNLSVFMTNVLKMWSTFLKKDLSTFVPEQAVPVYIVQGTNDYTTTFNQAKIYFDNLRAPEKKFYAIEEAAHWPHVEQYDEFERIVKRDILKIKDITK
jgi:pimeloyl-ACP methyl ester carboxylesterase